MNFLPFCVWDNAALLSRAQKSFAIQDPETTARGGRRGREHRHPNIPPSRPRAMSSIIVFSVVRALFFSRHHAQTPRRRWMISHPSSQSTASFRERDIHFQTKDDRGKSVRLLFPRRGVQRRPTKKRKRERERERERERKQKEAQSWLLLLLLTMMIVWFYNKKVCVCFVWCQKKEHFE